MCLGNCLEVNVPDGVLNIKDCISFSTGCPSNHYWNYDFYKCEYYDCK